MAININFNFIGEVVAMTEKENFKPYSVIEKDNGKMIIMKFSGRCGTDNHIIQASGWCPKEGRKEIYTMKQVDGKNEKYTVKWADRNKPTVLAVVPDFKKFIIDVNPAGYVSELEHLVDDFKDGSVTDEKMTKYNITSLDEAVKALEKAKAGRQEFLVEEEFTEALKKFVDSNPEGKFEMQGDYELRENNGKWYSSLKVRKITRYVDKDDENITSSNMIVKMLITNESLSETDDKFIVSGFFPVYDKKDDNGNNKYKFAPINVCVYKNEANEKRIQGYKKFLAWTDDDDTEKTKEVGFVCRLHNGSDRVKLTYDMLSDEQKEAVDFELTTIEDIEKEMNGVYGERKTDIEILKFSKGYTSGGVDSAYTVDDINGTSEDDIDLDDFDLEL